MTHGEAGLGALSAVSAFVLVFVAAKAADGAFAFHAVLGAAFSLWACFAIFNRYFTRPAAPPPQEINGRPNYNMGPIKFAAARSGVALPPKRRHPAPLVCPGRRGIARATTTPFACAGVVLEFQVIEDNPGGRCLRRR